jgi:uncharacterized membrane protein YfcA
LSDDDFMVAVLAAAVAAGLVLGLLGAGGAMVILPALVAFAHVKPDDAAVISLIVVGVISPVGIWQHWRAGHVHWRDSLTFAAASTPAAFLGARLSHELDNDVIMLLFAGVMTAAAVTMLLRPELPTAGSPAPRRLVGVGACIGLLTGIVGIGGGFAIVPALVVLAGVPMRDASGASLVVITLNVVAGLVGKLGGPPIDWTLTLSFTAAALAGSVLGSLVAPRASAAGLRRAFAVLLLGVAGWIFSYSVL